MKISTRIKLVVVLAFAAALAATLRCSTPITSRTILRSSASTITSVQLRWVSPVAPKAPKKVFPLRGTKDSPPYLHDGRLLTLEDTLEFFNLILQSHMTPQEKSDLVAFLRVL